MIYAAGSRPRIDDIERLAATHQGDGLPFAISHRGDQSGGWLELLAQGLTFDCAGLAPGNSAALPPASSIYGLDVGIADQRCGAVVVAPGPHLAAGANLLPLVRTIVGLAARIAALPDTLAVSWHSAESWVEPGFFSRTVNDWLRGGVFPSLSLTSLTRADDGTITSQGLKFLIGQEIELMVPQGAPAADAARIAVRLIHDLVETGPLKESRQLSGPGRERLYATPNPVEGKLHVAWVR